MSNKSRLETVYRLRETEEDRARAALADAQRSVLDAEKRLEAAKHRAMADERNRSTAAHWSMVETAHVRALQEARQAEFMVKSAETGLMKKRDTYIGAHTKTEALKRVIQTRKAEAMRAQEKAEQKIMDEVAMLLFLQPA